MVDLKHANDIIELMQRINSLLTKTAISDDRAKEFEREYIKLSKLVKSFESQSPESTEIEEHLEEDATTLLLKQFINNLKF
jgi:proteasome assembly chaperone (PAC2) family protein